MKILFNSQKKVYLRRNTYNEKIGIMTDSHSGILTEEAEKLGIKVLPMPFYIDDELYLEGVDLSREEFYEKLRQGVNVSTSQPSPQEVMSDLSFGFSCHIGPDGLGISCTCKPV